MRSQRIGLLGGTFDPVHIGHLVTGVNVRHALDLDVVLLVVANDPWQKADRDVTPARDRLSMVEAAVAGVDGLEASDVELRRGGVSYTADTLVELGAGGAELFLILG
ncbi:MAG: nicotinate-nucleotide adenylyltransferase, partial [Actinomycetota bacterium]|nr:nicotinate-nucleotide adenylyltransferase [Actinomycetota bacterium]